MLVGVASLPPSFPPSRTGILHHKKTKLPKHLQQSVCIILNIQQNFYLVSSALPLNFNIYRLCTLEISRRRTVEVENYKKAFLPQRHY